MEKMIRTRAFMPILFLLIGFGALNAQNSVESKAIEYVQANAEKWGLSAQDVQSLRVTDIVPTKHNGVTHVYLTQQINGVDIEGATITAYVTKNEKVGATAARFEKDLKSRASVQSAKINQNEGLEHVLGHLGYETSKRKATQVVRQEPGNIFWFDGANISQSDVRAQKKYMRTETGQFTLVWEYQMFSNIDGELWSVFVDAENGNLIKKESLTVHCQFEHGYLSHPKEDHTTCLETAYKKSQQAKGQKKAVNQKFKTNSSGDGAQYNVVALPSESPNHGARTLVVDPSHIEYSPFGWHSDDGDAQPDYTYTRGNNVHAFLDRNWDSDSDSNVDGGEALIFDFEFDQAMEPADYSDAAVTNLFYLNNMMHDLSYAYGFDESAGNFQEFNPNNQGTSGDAVQARAQRGADDPVVCGEDTQPDGNGGSTPCVNNANMGTPGDGGNPAMNMFVWTATAGSKFLNVESPSDLAGLLQTSIADFGQTITTTPVTGDIALAKPNLACGELEVDLSGKIALIDRGNCDFSFKVLQAQNAGAIAAIVCNFEDAYLPNNTMGAGDNAADVTIPSVFITRSDCGRLVASMEAGNTVTVSLVSNDVGGGPERVDGDFDNGIILHEHTHGISNRLTGGPSSAGCLGGAEANSMGEGWSDFMSLIATVRLGDVGETARGIGTYAQREEAGGRGIRPFPYSRNMTVNPHTYEDVAFTAVPHGAGSVWCVMLWDLYWAFVDVYGFSEDVMDGDKGNNIAVQLVFDGMKMQPCRPGFVDARDAILLADELNNGGVNQDLIWSVFARRGLGWGADQGDQTSASDGQTSFALNPKSIKELKVAKAVTPFINPGEDIEVTLTVVNHKGSDVTNVVVADVLPQGVSFKSVSNGPTPTIENDQLLFELGAMSVDQEMEITYVLNSNPEFASDRIFFDDMENGDDNWDFFLDAEGELNIWTILDVLAFSGDNSWYMQDVDGDSKHELRNREAIEISATKPFLRFYHNYDLEARDNGGIVMISTDGGMSFDRVDDKIIRGNYAGRIQYTTFALPNLNAYWGSSDGYIPTYIDLRDYIGQDIIVEFRYASDDDTQDNTSTTGIGWFIDDFEYMNMLSYNGEVCVTSDQGGSFCSIAPEEGTIVESVELSVGIEDIKEGEVFMDVQPNPAQRYLNVILQSKDGLQDAKLSMISATGQKILEKSLILTDSKKIYPLEINHLPKGIYFVRVMVNNQHKVVKVVLQ